MRQPARKFLAPNGRTTSKPLRELHDGGDPPEVVARIAEARSLCDEPEFVSKAIIDVQTDLAEHYNRLRYFAELEEAHRLRASLTLESRMAEVQRRAKMRHVNVSGELAVCRRMLEAARAGGRREPQAAVRKVEALEHRLDYRPDLEEAA